MASHIFRGWWTPKARDLHLVNISSRLGWEGITSRLHEAPGFVECFHQMLRINVYFIVVSLGGLIGAVAGAAPGENGTHVLLIILLEVFVSPKVLLFHINNLIFKYFIHD